MSKPTLSVIPSTHGRVSEIAVLAELIKARRKDGTVAVLPETSLYSDRETITRLFSNVGQLTDSELLKYTSNLALELQNAQTQMHKLLRREVNKGGVLVIPANTHTDEERSLARDSNGLGLFPMMPCSLEEMLPRMIEHSKHSAKIIRLMDKAMIKTVQECLQQEDLSSVILFVGAVHAMHIAMWAEEQKLRIDVIGTIDDGVRMREVAMEAAVNYAGREEQKVALYRLIIDYYARQVAQQFGMDPWSINLSRIYAISTVEEAEITYGEERQRAKDFFDLELKNQRDRAAALRKNLFAASGMPEP